MNKEMAPIFQTKSKEFSQGASGGPAQSRVPPRGGKEEAEDCMRPGSRQAQVVARTGWCGEGVGSEDARTWKSRLLSSKSHLKYPQHCSFRGPAESGCASGARPPQRRLWRSFLLALI